MFGPEMTKSNAFGNKVPRARLTQAAGVAPSIHNSSPRPSRSSLECRTTSRGPWLTALLLKLWFLAGAPTKEHKNNETLLDILMLDA